MGSTLKDVPDISWKYVKSEKSEDIITVLQFPFNGEPPRVGPRITGALDEAKMEVQSRLVETEITSNKDHFVRNHGGIPEIEENDLSLR